ncbi:MAG: hypothetical protein NZ822_03080 [Patescibacteria group bacterium]|nr:hypothetical protein [Patescibacteria group bacterium]
MERFKFWSREETIKERVGELNKIKEVQEQLQDIDKSLKFIGDIIAEVVFFRKNGEEN